MKLGAPSLICKAMKNVSSLVNETDYGEVNNGIAIGLHSITTLTSLYRDGRFYLIHRLRWVKVLHFKGNI